MSNWQEELREHLQRAVEWLESSEHPEGALMTHHGIYAARKFDRFQVSLCPRGAQNGPVVIFNASDVRFDREEGFENPITPEQQAELIALVGTVRPVTNHWNGAGTDSLSMLIAAEPSEGVDRLLITYHAGCPEHPENRVFCKCGWWGRGAALAVKPEGWH